MKYNVDIDLKPRPVLQELIEDLTNKMLAQKRVLADLKHMNGNHYLVQGLKSDIKLLDQVILKLLHLGQHILQQFNLDI